MKYKSLWMLSMLSTAVLLSACGSDASNTSEENTETEIVASADTETETTEEITETESTETTDTETEADDAIAWIELGELDNYQELRAALEADLGITTNDSNEKEGILYKNPDTLKTDQNTTLLLNLRNQDYALKFVNERTQKITAASESSFSDIDEESALAAAINAYYNLLPDETEGVFNGDATLNRAQAMALVMRAITPVTESGEPESVESFTSAVGYTSYTDYAAAVDSLAYLSVTNGTLNTDNFTTAMTKGEFTYLVIKSIVNDYDNYIRANLSEIYLDYDTCMRDFYDTSSVEITLFKDAGDIFLTDAIANPDNGVPTDMYETFKLGIRLGIITESDLEDWDTAITKTGAVTTFLNDTLNFMFGGYADNNYRITEDTTSTLTTRREHNEAVASGEFTDTYEDTRPAEEVTYETTASYDLWQNTEYGEYGETSLDQAWQNWYTHAQEEGADGARGYYWYYEKGSAAGSNGSYLVYMREGSPYYGQVFQYGDTLLDGSINKNGTNQEYYDYVDHSAEQQAIDAGIATVDEDGNVTNINLDLLEE